MEAKVPFSDGERDVEGIQYCNLRRTFKTLLSTPAAGKSKCGMFTGYTRNPVPNEEYRSLVTFQNQKNVLEPG